MLIYKATNIITNKSYIGKTETSFNIRIESHKSKSLMLKNTNCIFHNSIHKHGFDNIKWEILEDDIQDETILNERETFNILKYDTFMPNGYNMTLGGEGISGFKHAIEFKNKMHKRMSGKNNSMYGKLHSKETKILCGKKNIGKKISELTRKRLSESGKKKIFSEKHKENLTKAMLLRWQKKKENKTNKV